MADVELTAGDDVYTHPTGLPYTTIYGRAGNDRITITGGANVLGGPGNDVITNLVPAGQMNGGLGYWDNPAAITVDLEAGYALDGWGGRDTFTNFLHAHTSGRDGDVLYGSRYGDDIFVNGFNWTNRSPGRATLDLRGGDDRVTIPNLTPQQASIVASSDGRVVTVSANNYTATLFNIETLRLVEVPNNDWSRRIDRDFRVIDLIDFSRVGADTLLAPGQGSWGGAISYSFMAAAPAYGGGEGGSGFVAPSADYQAAVRAILAQLATQLDVSFTEVADSAAGYGQLRFGANQQTATKGYAFIPGTVSDDRAGDVWLDVETLTLLQPGQEGWQVLLHELGHALGLSHPIPQGTDTPATVLLDAWNHNGYTVMSPNTVTSGLWQSWFGPLDLQALQRLYGSRTQTANPGNDVHRLTDALGNSLSSLRDSGGFDTLDASGLSVGAYLDLTPGRYSSAGLTARGSASVDNLLVEAGSIIEAVVGTPFDDVLLGNSAANLFWPGRGNDWIEGRGGIDTVILDTPRAGQTVQRLDDGSGAWLVSDAAGADGSNTLLGIARVYFSDRRVALDVEGRAGEAARIAATVFGPTGPRDALAAGIALQTLDAGGSALDAYAGAIASARFQQLAGGSDHLAFVKQMFRNLVNVEAPTETAQTFVDAFLASGAYTQASFAQAVSSLAQVDMVGLGQTGLEYLY
jgi:serralysin